MTACGLLTTLLALACVALSSSSPKVYGPSHIDKVNILFELFDIDPKNGFLGFSELHLFQELTDPQLPLGEADYRALVRLIGSGRTVGLSISEFNSSYYEYRNVLGTDLDRDYEKIVRIVSRLHSRAW